MKAEVKKEIRIATTILVGLIFVAIMGYIAGRREATKESDPLREEIETLSKTIKEQNATYLRSTDSLKSISKKEEVKIDIINEIKKAIRNEIKKSTESVYFTPDSLHQHFVDSIRAGKGFYKIQY